MRVRNLAGMLGKCLLAITVSGWANQVSAVDIGVDSSWDAFLVWSSQSGVPVTISTPGFTVLDTNADGRDDIIIGASEPASAYRRISFDAASSRYWMDLSVPSPYPYPEHSSPLLRLVVTLQAGGAPKAITFQGHSVAIYDLATGRLERLADPGGYDRPVPVCAIDLDADGTKEIIVRDVVALRVMNSTLTRELGSTRVASRTFGSNNDAICGNLDRDPAIEVVLDNGTIQEFAGYTLKEQGSYETQSDGYPVGLAGAADIDGDSNLELFLAGPNSVNVLDVESGAIRWRSNASGTLTRIGATRVVDINRDGVKDLLTVTLGEPPVAGVIAAYDGRNGAELLRLTHPDVSPSAINAGDFDGDGRIEIATVLIRPFTGPNRMYVFDATTGALEWRSEDERGPVTAVGMGDLDGDGNIEVVAAPQGVLGVGDIRLVAFDAITFQRRWATSQPILSQAGTGPIESLAIGNVGGSAAPEIVVGLQKDATASVAVLDGRSRSLIRMVSLAGFEAVGALGLHDFDGDGDDEIVAIASAPFGSDYGGEAFVLDGASGQVLWHGGLGTFHSRRYTAVRIADVSGDGRADIIAAGTSREGLGGALMVVDGVTHAVRGEVSGPGYGGLEVFDADGDGRSEILLGTAAGRVEIRRATDLSVTRTLVPCETPVGALAANKLPGAPAAQVYFTCDDRVGIAELGTGVVAGVSGMVGYAVGYGNVLLLAGTAAAPRVTTSTAIGLRHLSPSPNAARPFVIPGNNSGGVAVFVVPRGKTMGGRITFGSFSGRQTQLELVETTRYGQLTLLPQGTFTYSMSELHEFDLFTVKAVDGRSESPPMTFALISENSAPSVPAAAEFTAIQGQSTLLASGATDPNGDNLAFTMIALPQKGSVQFRVDGFFTYTANPGATGDDSFQYFASDAIDRSSNSGTVTIHISTTTPAPPTTNPPVSGGGSSGGGGSLDLILLGLLFGAVAASQRRRRSCQAPMANQFTSTRHTRL